MDEGWYCETENRDFNGERRAVHIDHLIMPLHGAQRRFNDRAAGILILTASGNMRLLADNQGEGVVGVQPLIAPGEEYQYTSGAIIETPLGTMQGHYEMIDENGVPFSIDIPVFRLAVPTLIH